VVRGERQAARSPAAADAHPVRPRDDERGRLLQRHRELLDAHRRSRPGEPPFTLLDYFPDDYLLVIDESHVAVPQLHGQYAGDRSRKDMLVEHGFRLPSARDNRPLTLRRVLERVNQCVFLSATPATTSCACHPRRRADRPPDRSRRPRGDRQADQGPDRRPDGDGQRGRPRRPGAGHHAHQEDGRGPHRLPARAGPAGALPALDIDTIQRIEILRGLRLGEFDVLVGINLLREGLDLPEVSLVCILDADKEGFLRSETSLIQTIGSGGAQRRRARS
jgi:excinuclease ABC subunit B